MSNLFKYVVGLGVVMLSALSLPAQAPENPNQFIDSLNAEIAREIEVPEEREAVKVTFD